MNCLQQWWSTAKKEMKEAFDTGAIAKDQAESKL